MRTRSLPAVCLMMLLPGLGLASGRDPLVPKEPPVPTQPLVEREPSFVDDIGGAPTSYTDLFARYGITFKFKLPVWEHELPGSIPSFVKFQVDLDANNDKITGSVEAGGGRKGSGSPSLTFAASYDGESHEVSGGGKFGLTGTSAEASFTVGTNEPTKFEGGVSRSIFKGVFSQKGDERNVRALIAADWLPFEVDLGKMFRRYVHTYSALGRAAQRRVGAVIHVDTKRGIVKAVKDAAVRGVMIRFDLEGMDEMLPTEQLEQLDAEIDRLLSGETGGFVFQFGPQTEETFTTLSLKSWLDSGETTLGSLTRIRGCVVDEDDIRIIGQIDPDMPPIDGDFLVVALNAVYREGSTPFVSLDPNPLDFAGNQHSRIGGVPDALHQTQFVRVMLEADYDMKKIMLGEMDSGVPGLETTCELLARFPSQVDFTPHRFWLTPMTNQVGDVRIHGRTILFNSRVEVLTEREKMVGDKLIPSGDASYLDKRAANSMTRHYGELERQHPSFYRLHQVFDTSKLAAVLRYREVHHPILDAIADRPARHVSIPETYPGIGPKLIADTQLFVMGGAKSGIHLNRYRFREAPELAGLSEGEGRLPAEQVAYLDQGGVPELLVHEAIEDFANAELEECVEKIDRALAADPELSDGYAYRGLAQYELGNLDRALDDLDTAVAHEPVMRGMRAVVRLAAGDEAGALQDLDDVLASMPDEPEVWKLSATVKLGSFDLEGARADAARAIEMRPLDAEALSLHALIEDFGKMDPNQARQKLLEQRQLPLPLGLAFQRGFAAMLAEQRDEAISQLDRALGLVESRYADHPAVKSQHVRERIWMALSLLHSAGATRDYEPLQEVLDIAFSPDGQRVAFVAVNEAFEHVLVLDGRQEILPGQFRGYGREHEGERVAMAFRDDEGPLPISWAEFIPDDFPRLIFDPNGRHVACVLDSDSGWLVLAADLFFGPFDAIVAAPRFSEDGKQLEVAVAQGQDLVWKTLLLESVVGVDANAPGPRRIGRVPDGIVPQRVTVSDDGGHVLLQGYRPEADLTISSVYYLDGAPLPDMAEERPIRDEDVGIPYAPCPPPRFVPNTGRLAYVVLRDDKLAVAFGSRVDAPYDAISDQAGLAISNDGKHLAYVGGHPATRQEDKTDEPFDWYLNLDGKEWPIPPPSGPLTLSLDGQHVALVTDDGTRLVVDGHVTAVDAQIDSPTYAPDGQLAFVAHEVHMIEYSYPSFRGNRVWQSESSASRTFRRTRRQLSTLVRTIHAGLTTGLPGAVSEWFRQLPGEAADKLPWTRSRLISGRTASARHRDIRRPTFSRNGERLAYAAQVRDGWHVFVDGRPILLHPGFRYAEQMLARHPDWRTPYLLMAINAMMQGFDSPIDAPEYFDRAFQQSESIDPVFEDLERRFGSQQLKDVLLVAGAAIGWAGKGNPRPYLKRLESADGLAGEFARAFVGMVHPRFPNQRIARTLAERMQTQPIERPADAIVCGLTVAIVAEMELQKETKLELGGDPRRALTMIRSLHAQLPPKPHSPLEARMTSQFRAAGIGLAVQCYRELAFRDETLRRDLRDALSAALSAGGDGRVELGATLERARELIQQARLDSRQGDAPFVNALIEAQLEGLETELVAGVLQQLADRQRDWRDAAVDAAQQLQDLDLEYRPGRFERVCELLSVAVRQAATASDLLALNSLLADPMNFQRSIPVGDDLEETAAASVKLQGIRAELQMRQLAKTLSLAKKGD